jgi:hypothetical protein
MMVRVASVVPPKYCPPVSMRNGSSAVIGGVGAWFGGVMAHGSIAAGGGYGRETLFDEMLALMAELEQFGLCFHLGYRIASREPLGALLHQPGNEFHPGDTIFDMRAAETIELNRVLDRLGQGNRAELRRNPAPCPLHRLPHGNRSKGRVDGDGAT